MAEELDLDQLVMAVRKDRANYAAMACRTRELGNSQAVGGSTSTGGSRPLNGSRWERIKSCCTIAT
jgi:hypothetical protein